MRWFNVARLYSRFCWLLDQRLAWRMRGLGRILRLVRRDAVLSVHGVPVFFDHRVAPCYPWLLSGEWNEPETHEFLRAIVQAVDVPLRFIDVGANVGEMVVDIGRLRHVYDIVAFEPNPYCARALRISALLGGLGQVRVMEKVVTDIPSTVSFVVRPENPGNAGIAWGEEPGSIRLQATTLDAEIRDATGPTIVLIDVEGAELCVLQGGQHLIQLAKPLVIFEYNELGRARYTLDEVRAVLKDDYEIFRLCPKGLLDRELNETWNCVAVERQSVFYQFCLMLLPPWQGPAQQRLGVAN